MRFPFVFHISNLNLFRKNPLPLGYAARPGGSGMKYADFPGIIHPDKAIHKNITRSDIYITWTY